MGDYFWDKSEKARHRERLEGHPVLADSRAAAEPFVASTKARRVKAE
jgi:hypothetical protein